MTQVKNGLETDMADPSTNYAAPVGEHDLSALMAEMSPKLDPRTFVFVTVTDAINDSELSMHISKAMMVFRESEGVTLILEQQYAESAGLDFVFPCCRITLQIHSALDAVGFLAAIIPVLAKHGMGVNPVAGYFHDHLFVPADRAKDAVKILHELSDKAKLS